jgi:hypothetical protein
MRQVRLTLTHPGELARVGISAVEVECVIVSVVPGLLTVKVKRTPAKVTSAEGKGKRKRGA